MDDISNPERSRHMDQQDMGMWCGAEPGLAVNLFGMLLAVAWSAGASRITSLLIFWIVLPVLLCVFPINCPCPCHRPYLCLSTGPCVVVLAIALITFSLPLLLRTLLLQVSFLALVLVRPCCGPCFVLALAVPHLVAGSFAGVTVFLALPQVCRESCLQTKFLHLPHATLPCQYSRKAEGHHGFPTCHE